MIDDEEHAWPESLMPRVRTVVERASSGATSSEYVIDLQRLGGRHVRLRLVADVVTENDEQVIVSQPHRHRSTRTADE